MDGSWKVNEWIMNISTLACPRVALDSRTFTVYIWVTYSWEAITIVKDSVFTHRLRLGLGKQKHSTFADEARQCSGGGGRLVKDDNH